MFHATDTDVCVSFVFSVCKDWRREIEKIKWCRRRISCMMYDVARGKKHDDSCPAVELAERIQVQTGSSRCTYTGTDGILLVYVYRYRPDPLGVRIQVQTGSSRCTYTGTDGIL